MNVTDESIKAWALELLKSSLIGNLDNASLKPKPADFMRDEVVKFPKEETEEAGFYGDNGAILRFDGYRRASMMESIVVSVLRENIPGDIVETGVWQGGITMFMAAVLKLNNAQHRKVYNFDSFQGIMPVNQMELEKYPSDARKPEVWAGAFGINSLKAVLLV